MALQYSTGRCGDWYHHHLHQSTLQAAFNVPLLRGDASARAPPRPPRLEARAEHHHRRGLGLTSGDDESNAGPSSAASLLERSSGRWPHNLVATPHYSVLLRKSRRRHHHELRMRTRDRVFLSISDWVFRRVKDPLVEIDPVTVNTAILAEQHGEGGPVSSVATGPSLFGHRLPGISKGAKRTALIAAILLLLAALLAAAILAMQGKKKKNASDALPVERVAADGAPPPGSATNGVAREEVAGDSKPSFSEAESDKGVVRQSQSMASASSDDNQSASLKPPIPHYSTALEQADLPLPPSLSSAGTKGSEALDAAQKTLKEESSNVSEKSGEAVQSLKTVLQDEESHAADERAPVLPEADSKLNMEEEVLSSNGVMSTGNAAVEPDSAATEDTTSTDELAAGANESVSESAQPFASKSAVSETASAAPKPSTAEGLVDERGDQEYVLIGDSTALSSISDMPAQLSAQLADLPKRKVARPQTIAVKVAKGSTPAGKSSAQPLSKELASESASDKRRKEYAELLERALPAVSVCAGVVALSSLSGVDGAFQVVGAFAAASVLTRDFMWARPREQLLEDVRNIKNHKQLVGFLKDRKIIPEAWYQ